MGSSRPTTTAGSRSSVRRASGARMTGADGTVQNVRQANQSTQPNWFSGGDRDREYDDGDHDQVDDGPIDD